jgi:hypothetical protein
LLGHDTMHFQARSLAALGMTAVRARDDSRSRSG